MRAVDEQINRLRDSYWEEETRAAANKTVVLVEGDDDKRVLEALLRRRSRTFETRVRVVAAGGRKQVLAAASRFPRSPVHLLVDRDTWTEQDIAQHARPELYVTAGWCLENLFLEPAFLHAYDPRVATAIAAARESWVRAGAFWWTLQRMRERQQRWHEALGGVFGAPHPSLAVGTAHELTVALSKLLNAADLADADLDLASFARDYERCLAELLALPEAEQWRHVHGKTAFKLLLVPTLETGRSHQDWRVALTQHIAFPPPAPFDGLLAQLLA